MSDCLVEIPVRKITRTHADILAAVGLADLLSPATGSSARIVEGSDEFTVKPATPLTDEFVAALPIDAGYPFVKSNDKVTVPETASQLVDYKGEGERVRLFHALRKEVQAGHRDQTALQQLQQSAPRLDWGQLRGLVMLQGDDACNKANAAIGKLSIAERRRVVRDGLRALAAGEHFKPPWDVKLVQVFTPSAAKGYARLKPDSTGRGDPSKEQWAEPFLEWLKYRGYFRIACPILLGPKNEHVRLLCPVPADISVSALATISTELRAIPLGKSAPKVDCLAVLSLARLLIEHSEEYHPLDIPPIPGLSIAGLTPARLISGVSITYYQSMGSARAVSAMFNLALPAWFDIDDRMRADQWLSALDEHRRALRSLNDTHSDEIGLLIQYRRFLDQRRAEALRALLQFAAAYGQFLIRAREQKRRVPAFTVNTFKEVVVGLDRSYADILEDSGFKAVAAAVRRATVSAQALKAMSKDHREIRYDLIPELRRKASVSDKAPFLEAVANFVAQYNVENARRQEMRKTRPPNVTTEEFEAFCRQVESRPVSTVGALLCAYGTCRDPRAPDVPTEVQGHDSADTGNEEENDG